MKIKAIVVLLAGVFLLPLVFMRFQSQPTLFGFLIFLEVFLLWVWFLWRATDWRL